MFKKGIFPDISIRKEIREMGTLAPLFFAELIIVLALLIGNIVVKPDKKPDSRRKAIKVKKGGKNTAETEVSETSADIETADIVSEETAEEIAEQIFSEVLENSETPEETETADSTAEESSESEKSEEHEKKSFAWYYAVILKSVTAFAVFLGLTDLLKIADFGNFHGAFAFMAVMLVISMLVTLLNSQKQRKTFKFIQKTIIAVFLLELTILQFPSYRMFLGDYKEVYISLNDMAAEGSNYDEKNHSITIHGKETAKVWYENFNEKLATVKIEAKRVEKKVSEDEKPYYKERPVGLKINGSMNDDTHKEPRTNVVKWTYTPSNSSTEYTTAYLSGKTEKLIFEVNGVNNNGDIEFSGFTLNSPIPFDISALRVFLMLFLPVLCYMVVNTAFMQTEWVKRKALCYAFSAFTAFVGIVVIWNLVWLKTPDTIKKHFEFDSGNQMTQELVDAFEEKQLSLLDEPSDELKAMEDPYDWGERESQGVSAKWDHLYYNGKYYSYYGIAPVILFFMPFHKIFKHYAPTDMFVGFFSIMGVIFLTLLYNAFMKRWGKKTGTGFYICGNIMLITACGIYYSPARPVFYEIAISSGFMFVTLGAFLLISSNAVSEGKTSLIKAFFASIFLGLAVLCRPTLAVYAVCGGIYYLIGFKNSAFVKDKEGNITEKKFRRIAYLACAFIPLFVIASVQMWYNYARFGSVLDFGIQYSLTINDFVDSEYHTIFVLITMFAYLFGVPNFQFEYPFVSTTFRTLRANGYYFKDNGQTSGIFFLVPIVWSYLFSKTALANITDKKTKIQSAVLVGLPCFLMPLVILFSVWESGYAVRYVADFSWQMIIGAYAIFFFIYLKSKNETIKRLMRIFIAFSTVFTLYVTSFQIVDFSFGADDYPDINTKVIELLEFWE